MDEEECCVYKWGWHITVEVTSMRRTNIFRIVFKHPERVKRLAVGCAVLWNKLNFKRRQSFFKGQFDWDSKIEYDEFKGWIGSATAQQIIRKNDANWRGFFTLLKAHPEVIYAFSKVTSKESSLL